MGIVEEAAGTSGVAGADDDAEIGVAGLEAGADAPPPKPGLMTTGSGRVEMDIDADAVGGSGSTSHPEDFVVVLVELAR